MNHVLERRLRKRLFVPSLDVHRLKAGVYQEALQELEPQVESAIKMTSVSEIDLQKHNQAMD